MVWHLGHHKNLSQLTSVQLPSLHMPALQQQPGAWLACISWPYHLFPLQLSSEHWLSDKSSQGAPYWYIQREINQYPSTCSTTSTVLWIITFTTAHTCKRPPLAVLAYLSPIQLPQLKGPLPRDGQGNSLQAVLVFNKHLFMYKKYMLVLQAERTKEPHPQIISIPSLLVIFHILLLHTTQRACGKVTSTSWIPTDRYS